MADDVASGKFSAAYPKRHHGYSPGEEELLDWVFSRHAEAGLAAGGGSHRQATALGTFADSQERNFMAPCISPFLIDSSVDGGASANKR